MYDLFEVCWQCNGDKTVDEEVCPLCEASVSHPDCRLALPVVKNIPCPICQDDSDDNSQFLPLEVG